MIPDRERNIYGSALGWQNTIQGTNVSVSGTLTRMDLDCVGARATLAGATLSTGTYYYFIPTAGVAELDVTLRASAVTGTHTITLYPVLSDCVSIKGTATSVSALVAATQATTSLTTLRGERGVILKIVVDAASSLTFDQADYSAL